MDGRTCMVTSIRGGQNQVFWLFFFQSINEDHSFYYFLLLRSCTDAGKSLFWMSSAPIERSCCKNRSTNEIVRLLESNHQDLSGTALCCALSLSLDSKLEKRAGERLSLPN